jgi:hypothetical protein
LLKGMAVKFGLRVKKANTHDFILPSRRYNTSQIQKRN